MKDSSVTSGPLTILHAPLKAPLARELPERVTGRISEIDPEFADLTEAYGIIEALTGMRDFDVVLTRGGKDRRRGQQDHPILARSSLVSVGQGQVLACDASTPIRIAPERWLTYSARRLPGRSRPHCHIGFHPHAGVQGEDGGIARKSDRGRKYIESISAMGDLLAFASAMRWTVTVGADSNARDIGDDPSLPHRVLRDHGLDVHAQGLDVIAGSKSLHLEVDETEPPDGVTDHPWLIAVSR
jgi:hypothetical protein